jgi:glycosyltransferase involved in cell wall biosynthesis
LKRIYFTVTNDLAFDQRMQRICTSLSGAGYDVVLVGRKLTGSVELPPASFGQKRLSCLFNKGFAFYAEYNLRLFLFLLFRKFDAVCAIDLDTIVPCSLASRIKGKERIYDAHELFCEMKEIVTRPGIRKFWKYIERKTVPRFTNGYTVNQPIRDIFQSDYGVDYEVIMNVPVLREQDPAKDFSINEKFLIYQGAVNEGRSFETLIPAFKHIDCPLHIYGDGNYLEQAKELVKKEGLEQKLIFKGKLTPLELRSVTSRAIMGFTLFENNGLNNYYSLANRFFDYIHAGIPQVCVDYPVYRSINSRYEVAVLVEDLSPESLAAAVNSLLSDPAMAARLAENCSRARMEFNWQQEEKKLISFYKNILPIE